MGNEVGKRTRSQFLVVVWSKESIFSYSLDEGTHDYIQRFI